LVLCNSKTFFEFGGIGQCNPRTVNSKYPETIPKFKPIVLLGVEVINDYPTEVAKNSWTDLFPVLYKCAGGKTIIFIMGRTSF
jgi:hypothetical protein